MTRNVNDEKNLKNSASENRRNIIILVNYK